MEQARIVAKLIRPFLYVALKSVKVLSKLLQLVYKMVGHSKAPLFDLPLCWSHVAGVELSDERNELGAPIQEGARRSGFEF